MVTAYLTACSFASPGVIFLRDGDQVWFWTYGLRLLQGESPYVDFFQFTAPGADVVYAAAFGALGPRLWVTGAVTVGLGVALSWLCFVVSSRLMSPPLAALATASYVVLVYGKALDATHHWFSMLPIIGAVAVHGGRPGKWRLAGCGTLLGAGSFFTQTHGAAAVLAFALHEAWRGNRCESLQDRRDAGPLLHRWLLLFGGYAFGLAALSGYFAVRAGLYRMWTAQVTYVWRYIEHYPLWPGLGFPQSPFATWPPRFVPQLVVYAMTATAYYLAARRFRSEAALPLDPARSTRILLLFLGVALLFEVAVDLNWLRVFGVAMPAIILLTSEIAISRRRYPALSLFAVALVGALSVEEFLRLRRHESTTVKLPAGIARTDLVRAEKLEWLAARLRPGERLFATEGPYPYVPLGLTNPAFLDCVGSTQETRPEFLVRTEDDLDRQGVAYVLEARGAAEQDGSAGHFHQYLSQSYRVMKVFSDGQTVWKRR